MNEASKAAKRRKQDWRYANRWLTGKVLDVGCGNDPLKKEDWPLVTEVVPYDKERGDRDAQFLPEIADESFDTVHNSHCLEHLPNTRGALTNFLRVVKPGGFVVVTVPEEFLYEYARFPSRFNPDHRTSFCLRHIPLIPSTTNVLNLLWKLTVDLEHLTLLTEHWDPAKIGEDQTLADAESAIEFVVRKPDPKEPW